MKTTKQLNKRPYVTPEIQIFQSLKEITLANTCNCDNWDDHLQSCGYCTLPAGAHGCPQPPSSCS